MPRSSRSPEWRFLAANADERETFTDLDTAVRLAAPDPVAPPNRLRDVKRITVGGQRYYLKTFHATPPKNRLRNAISAPRCRSDAEREALVASALRSAGFDAARPVAVGRRGRASFYLCAEVGGPTLAELLADDSSPAGLPEAAVRFCGRAFAAGFSLPDLSPDHVFVTDPATPRLALIDLHNGAIHPRPDARAARRALRRTVRALRGIAFPRPRALRLAVVFLRTAGLGHRAREIVERLPVFDTHSRYDAPGKGEAYATRAPRRHAAELRLLSAVWPGSSGAKVLDMPCGAGRLRDFLAAAKGVRWHGADRSRRMLDVLRATASDTSSTTPVALADALRAPFADRVFDGVVMFRFLHHLTPDLAREAIREATRIADGFVVVSFFHPLSAHHWSRRARELIRRRPRVRHALWTAELVDWFEAEGFRLATLAAQPPFLRDLRVAAFVRNG